MPTKTWVVGEEVLAADFNTFVQKQVVATFANAAARTAALPAPTAGMQTWLDDVKRMEVWDGTAWRIPASVPLGAGQFAMAGSYSGQPTQVRAWTQDVACDAGGNFVSAFPTAVNGVIMAHAAVFSQYAITANVHTITTSVVGGIVFQTATNTPVSGTSRIMILAVVW